MKPPAFATLEFPAPLESTATVSAVTTCTGIKSISLRRCSPLANLVRFGRSYSIDSWLTYSLFIAQE